MEALDKEQSLNIQIIPCTFNYSKYCFKGMEANSLSAFSDLTLNSTEPWRPVSPRKSEQGNEDALVASRSYEMLSRIDVEPDQRQGKAQVQSFKKWSVHFEMRRKQRRAAVEAKKRDDKHVEEVLLKFREELALLSQTVSAPCLLQTGPTSPRQDSISTPGCSWPKLPPKLSRLDSLKEVDEEGDESMPKLKGKEMIKVREVKEDGKLQYWIQLYRFYKQKEEDNKA